MPLQVPVAAPRGTPSSDFPSRAGIALVLGLTFAIYVPTLRYGFVHDDVGQIVENPAVHSWRAVPRYLTSHVWEGFLPEERTNYYRPLFLLWLRINDALFGNHVWAWHLTTILAHVLATYLVYLLAKKMSQDVAVLAALLFGLHPAHIEAVAWISGVTEPLLAALLLGSLICYISARTQGRRSLSSLTTGPHQVTEMAVAAEGSPALRDFDGRTQSFALRQPCEHASSTQWLQAVSLALFALAVLEKETALILPVLLLLYEWIFREKSGKPLQRAPAFAWCGGAIRRTRGYFLIVLLYVPMRVHALKQFSYALTPMSAKVLIQTWPSLIWFWIRHLLWPVGLCTFYDLRVVVNATLRNCALPAVLDLIVAVGLVVMARRSRAAAFFAYWLAIPLIPLLNLRIFGGDDFAHDRYLYLPSVGLALLLALGLKKVCTGSPRAFGLPVSYFACAGGLAVALAYGTLRQSSYFKDNFTFYAYAYEHTPHNRIVETNYASILGETGDYDRALEILSDVVARHPDYWSGAYNFAYTYYRMGRLAEAEHWFLAAIRLAPRKPEQYLYLGATRFRMGRTADAIPAVEQAIALRPTGYGYHFALGMMLKAQGDLNGALHEMKAELANFPTEQTATDQCQQLESEIRR